MRAASLWEAAALSQGPAGPAGRGNSIRSRARGAWPPRSQCEAGRQGKARRGKAPAPLCTPQSPLSASLLLRPAAAEPGSTSTVYCVAWQGVVCSVIDSLVHPLGYLLLQKFLHMRLCKVFQSVHGEDSRHCTAGSEDTLSDQVPTCLFNFVGVGFMGFLFSRRVQVGCRQGPCPRWGDRPVLSVCCFGSPPSPTPRAYLQETRGG